MQSYLKATTLSRASRFLDKYHLMYGLIALTASKVNRIRYHRKGTSPLIRDPEGLESQPETPLHIFSRAFLRYQNVKVDELYCQTCHNRQERCPRLLTSAEMKLSFIQCQDDGGYTTDVVRRL